MFDVAEKEKFNSKNKFTFNDLDNHLWKHEKGIAFDSQNFGFYCVMKDQDVTIYAWDQGGNNCKPCTSISKLTKDIKAGNTNLIDHVALKVENGKVTFVDNAMIYSLDLDIIFTKNALVEDGFGEPTYPVDIKSFDYQLAYYQKRYNYSEFQFMNQAMLTLGGGFGYDRESGRFYDDSVRYDASLGAYQPEEKEEKATGIYGAPKGFTKLDKDWTAAVGRFIEKLKKDRPEPIMGDTKKEKAKILDDIIKQYEKDLAKLIKSPKVKA
jgi:hypothetical protein